MRFTAPQRGQAPLAQPALQQPDVVVPEGEVVHKVDGVSAVVGVNGPDFAVVAHLELTHQSLEPGQIGINRLPLRVHEIHVTKVCRPLIGPKDPTGRRTVGEDDPTAVVSVWKRLLAAARDR